MICVAFFGGWEDCGFIEEDGFDVEFWGFVIYGFWESELASEACSYFVNECVTGDFGDVCYSDAGWVNFSSGTSAGYYGDVASGAIGDEECFLHHEVDGVDDEVVAGGEEAVGGFFVEERLFADDVAFWVNESDAFCHGVCLLFADFSIHGVELAVDVGDADFIEVDHGDFADA